MRLCSVFHIFTKWCFRFSFAVKQKVLPELFSVHDSVLFYFSIQQINRLYL